MRSFSVLFCFILPVFLLSSCGCKLDCPDCEKLDEKNCDCFPQVSCLCSNGVLDEGEEDIDCGGDCDPCFECMTSYCALLAGATSDQEPKTSKKWIAINISPEELTATFFSSGYLYEIYDDPVDPERTGIGTGSWAFDDPADPIGKTLYLSYKSCPPAWTNPYPWMIMQLTADTLKVQNETGGIMILVPES